MLLMPGRSPLPYRDDQILAGSGPAANPFGTTPSPTCPSGISSSDTVTSDGSDPSARGDRPAEGGLGRHLDAIGLGLGIRPTGTTCVTIGGGSVARSVAGAVARLVAVGRLLGRCSIGGVFGLAVLVPDIGEGATEPQRQYHERSDERAEPPREHRALHEAGGDRLRRRPPAGGQGDEVLFLGIARPPDGLTGELALADGPLDRAAARSSGSGLNVAATSVPPPTSSSSTGLGSRFSRAEAQLAPCRPTAHDRRLGPQQDARRPTRPTRSSRSRPGRSVGHDRWRPRSPTGVLAEPESRRAPGSGSSTCTSAPGGTAPPAIGRHSDVGRSIPTTLT